MRENIRKIVIIFKFFHKKPRQSLTSYLEEGIIRSMKLYEHNRQFLVTNYDIDFKDECKVSTVLSYLQEAANSSAEELGFGYSNLKTTQCTFMVTNLCCEFKNPIPLGETIRVKTWPTPPSFVIFGREYQIFSQSDELLMNASARWCLFDIKEQRILPSKTIENQDYSTYNTTKALENVKWKIPAFKPEEGELKFSIKIANSEYDHNMHVNNARYADYSFNCFSVAELASKKLKSFMISYVKQCKEGETLRYYRKETEDGGYLVHGFNDAEQVVTQALIYFA